MGSDWPKESWIRWGPDPSHAPSVLGERVVYYKVRMLSAVSCSETAEPIDFRQGFGLQRAKWSTSPTLFATWRQCAHMRGHIGITWRIRLNRPSSATMRSYVKLLGSLIMAALCNTGAIFCVVVFLLSFIFFPRLISAVADWMSTILRHMVWP